MKNYYKKRAGIALALLAGGLASPGAQAQSAIFTNAGSNTYGLINTDAIALYINDRGDIGAPYRAPGRTNKANGLLDGAGQPYLNSDGSVNTSANIGGITNGSYGLLVNTGGVPASGSLADSVRAKSEYLTAGPSTVAEGFSLIGDNANLRVGSPVSPNFLTASNFTVQSFTASASGAPPSLVSQLFRKTGTLATQGLQVTQTVTLPTNSNPAKPSLNLAQFTISFTNTDTQTLTGLRYARGLNPNQDGSLPNSTGNTMQTFGGNPADPKSFLINSNGSGSRMLGLAVHPGDPNTVGARVSVANTKFEASLLSTPDSYFSGASNYVTLNSGFGAAYHKSDGTTQTTSDFTTDGGFKPSFGTLTNGDYSVLLESDIFSLAPGATTDFTFYIEAEQRGIAASVPEPGAFALLFASLSLGLMARRRRAR